MLALGRVNDRETRAIPQLDRLLCQGERPRDERLRRDDRRQRRDDEERIEKPARREEIERILDRLWHSEEKRALPEVVQQQRGKHEHEEREADGPLPEVTEVGVQGLRTRDREEYRAQHGEAREPVLAHGRLLGRFRAHRPKR